MGARAVELEISNLLNSLRAKRSNPSNNILLNLDCFVALSGSSQ